jgi:hypothetical protein
VATGAAATRTAETVAADPEGTATKAATTERLESPGPSGRSRVPIVAGAMLAVAALVAATVALTSGGGGDSPSAASKTRTDAVTSPAPKKTAPKPLTRQALIAKADAICAHSQATFKRTHEEFPNGENEADLHYSEILSGISTGAVRKFDSLDPPATVSSAFDEYVRAQERVKVYDRQALRAARAGNTADYLAARERRDNEAEERYELARAVGLRECSSTP